MKYQIAVLGGGPAGYTAAGILGKAGKQVVLFEKNNIGGVCLNEGCIPTKALLYSAKVHDMALSAAKYGVMVDQVGFDLKKSMSRKSKIIRKLTLGIKQKLSANHVDIVVGEATLCNEHTISCGDETYECDYMILCNGSETFIPPIPGLNQVDYWTHREALECKELPASLTIIGGGVIGMEFASFYNSIGVRVTVIEMLGEILKGFDGEIAALLRAEYAKRGIQFHLGTKVTRVAQDDAAIIVDYMADGTPGQCRTDKLLVSVGRTPAREGYGLENLHLIHNGKSIMVNGYMQSSINNVYVCGDITGNSMLAHTAVREAEVAANHILGYDVKMSYKAIPGVVYTNPEVASIGMTEELLQSAGFSYRAEKLPMSYSGRFVAENEGANGMCKVLIDDDDTILGAHIIGNPSSELIVIIGIMIAEEKKYTDLKSYVFPHPTVGEIFKEI